MINYLIIIINILKNSDEIKYSMKFDKKDSQNFFQKDEFNDFF